MWSLFAPSSSRQDPPIFLLYLVFIVLLAIANFWKIKDIAINVHSHMLFAAEGAVRTTAGAHLPVCLMIATTTAVSVAGLCPETGNCLSLNLPYLSFYGVITIVTNWCLH